MDNQTVTDTGNPGRIINDSVFISYFPEDKPVAEMIKNQLAEQNIDFFDIYDAEYRAAEGKPVHELYLSEVLESCVVFIPVCNARNYNQHPNTDPLYSLWEAITNEGKMKVIPVWTEPVSVNEASVAAAASSIFTHLQGLVPGHYKEIFCTEKGLSIEAINAVMNELPNPFKGPIPYSRRDRIYGRSTDILALYDCIRQNKLTLLYSKSGNGKTSLIQAGLIPELEKSRLFIPVYIRVTTSEINSWSAIRELIEKEINEFTNVDKIGYRTVTSVVPGREAASLFEYLYTTEIRADADGKGLQVIPILIFDQFEELFTISSSLKNNLMKELEYLLENKIPHALQEIEPDNEQSEITYRKFIEKIASKDKPFRIVLSFREEYFLSIENFKDSIPTFFYTNGRYRLESFSVKESKDTIVRISRFTIDEDVAGSLSRLLSRIQAEIEETEFKEDAKNISPFILSLTCKDIFDELKTNNGLRQMILDADRNNDITGFKIKVERAIQNYYENSFIGITDAAKIFIERKLISTEGKRTLFPYNDIKNYFKPENEMDPAAADSKNQELTANVNRLIDDTKIRYLNKNKYLNTTHIEILHDQLVQPIKKRRDDREHQEREERANRELEEIRLRHVSEMKKLHDEEEKKYLERQNEEEKKYLERQNRLTKEKNRNLWIAASLVAISLVAIFIVFYNKTVQIINDFAVVEEKVVLDSKEKTQGTYAALAGADSFYSRIIGGLAGFKKIPFLRKMPQLEQSIDTLLMNAYNKTPCYLIQDIKRLPLGTKYYVRAGNKVYTVPNNGTLHCYDINSFTSDSLVLKPPKDSLPLPLNKDQQLDYQQTINFQSNDTHSLFVIDNSLYVFKIADKLKPVYSIKLSSYVRPEFSADGKFIILSFNVRKMAKANSGQRIDELMPRIFKYIIIRLDDRDTTGKTLPLTLDEGESLITVVAGPGQSVIYYIRKLTSRFNIDLGKPSPGNGGWGALVNSTFTILRSMQADKKLNSRPLEIYTGTGEDDLLNGGVVRRSTDGRYLFFWQNQNEAWSFFDLFSTTSKTGTKLRAGIVSPLGICIAGNDTLVITSDMKVESIVQKNATPWEIKINNASDSSADTITLNRRIVGFVKANLPGWVTVYFADGYQNIYPGLLNLATHEVYFFGKSLYVNQEVSFYLESEEKAVVIPGTSYALAAGVGSNSVIHWFFKRTPNDADIPQIKEWVRTHRVPDQ